MKSWGSFFDGIDRGVGHSNLVGAITVGGPPSREDVERMFREMIASTPSPRIEFVHPREYRRRAIAAIWRACAAGWRL